MTYIVSCGLLFFLNHLYLVGILCQELRDNSVPSLERADDRISLVNLQSCTFRFNVGHMERAEQ